MAESNPITPNLKTGTFSYEDMKNMFNEEEKSGKARRLQLENWKRYCEYDRPTKQKYNVTAVYDEPLEKKEDGRKHNGRKSKTQEEFDYLINAFLNREIKRNMYHVSDSNHKTMICAYFTSNEIAGYFGLYNKDVIYSGKKDEGINQEAYSAVLNKILAKRRYLIVDKIKKLDWLDITPMVMVYKKGSRTPHYYDEERYETYIKLRKTYLYENRLMNLGEVVERDKWQEMEKELTEAFNKQFEAENGFKASRVTTCTRITPNEKYKSMPENEYTLEGIEEMRHRFNFKCFISLKESFEKEGENNWYCIGDIALVLLRYVLLSDWRDYKELLTQVKEAHTATN